MALAKKVIQIYRKKLIEDWNDLQNGMGINKFSIQNKRDIWR
jgi:hypothetical protein